MNFKENESATKLRGGYYTPQDLACYLSRWVLSRSPSSVLEPSCGDGVFFRALSAVGASSIKSLMGFEIEPTEAVTAQASANRIQGAQSSIVTRDFLGWALSRINGDPIFDAVLGNPPFIRYQYLDEDLQGRSEALFGVLGLPFTRHTNAWVPFILASIALLRPGGRLAMVVPAELLHVLHAQGLRSYLVRQCSRVLVIDPEQLWFPDALQGAVLLMAEKRSQTRLRTEGVSILRVRSSAFLDEDPEIAFETADYVSGSAVLVKWMPALLSRHQREIIAGVEAHDAVHRFSDIAEVDVGIVTGANKFFLVPDAIVEEYDLFRWAHPMFGRSEHVPGIIYDKRTHEANRQAGLPTNFLWFGIETIKSLPSRARAYIESGERENLHTRYKCRIRTPWYRVPYVHAAPVGMLKRCHDFPRLVLNRVGAYTTDTAYRIKPHGVQAEHLVYSFVNSLTALSAELEGRHYGGGVLELVPSEIERLLVPVVPTTSSELAALDEAVRSRANAESLLFPQDEMVLAQVGLSTDDIACIQEAWFDLRDRRHRVTDAEDQDTTSEKGFPELAGA